MTFRDGFSSPLSRAKQYEERAKTSTKRRQNSEISCVFGAAQKCLMLYSYFKVVWKGGGIYEVVWREKRKYLAW